MKYKLIIRNLRMIPQFGATSPEKILMQVKNILFNKLMVAGILFAVAFTSTAFELNVPEFSDGSGSYTISWDMRGMGSDSRLEEFNGFGWNLVSMLRSGSKTYTKSTNGTWSYRLMNCDGELGCMGEFAKDSVSVQHTPGIPSITSGNVTDSDGAYNVTWSKATGYVKSYQLKEDNVVVYDGQNRSFSFSGKADRSYIYQVRACNDADCSEYSESQSVTVVKIPTAPGNLTTSESVVTDGTLTLTWEPSQETVSVYRVEDTDTSAIIKQVTTTQADFINELANGSHDLAVRACNLSGCSELSNSVNVVVEMPPAVPSSFVVPSESQSGRFAVTWDTAGLAEATSSEIYRGLDGGDLAYYKTVNAPGGEETIFRIDERFVEDGTAAYKVRACNEFGCSEFTEIRSVDIALEFSEVVADSPVVHLPVPTNDQPGALTGEGGVSGGKATYSISLPVPPGRKGMQPELSLNYSSADGENRTGLGWSVSDGGGSIYRCSRIEAIDGENRAYEQVIDDRLCMDGSRLMLDSGTYGQTGSVYFTEIDNFSRVTLEQGSSLDDTAVFKVERKDGKIEYYGDTSGNAVDQPDGALVPFAWFLSKIEDRNGNTIKYVYSDGAEDKKLSKIVYTGFNGSDGNREITFNYIAADEFNHSYRQGAEIISSSRLTDIEFEVDGEFSHKINLAYIKGKKGQSLLSRMEYCADEACQNTTQPIHFAYDKRYFEFERETVSTDRTMHYRVANDFDGDGTRDVVRLTYLDQIPPGAPIKYELKVSSTGEWIDITGEFYNGYSNGGGFYPMDRPADFVRDGKADILGHQQGNFQVGSFNGVDFTPIGSTLDMSAQGPYIRAVRDFNLDGQLDLLTREPGAGVYRVRFRCPNDSSDWINFCGYKEITLLYNSNTVEEIKAVEDFNGDGLPDLFVADTWEQPGSSKILFGRLDASKNLHFDERTMGYLGAPSAFGHSALDHRLDANGDGLTDLVSYYNPDNSSADTIHLYLNRGLKTADNFIHYSFSSPVGELDNSLLDGAKVIDYNNDGKQELMFPGDIVTHFCYWAPSVEDPSQIDPPYCTNSTGATQILNSSTYESKNKAIYQWDAVSFRFNGSWSVKKISTELELPINIPTPDVDYNGDGNNDYLYRLTQNYAGAGGADGNPANPDDPSGYFPVNDWIGSDVSADTTYVVLYKESTTGGFSHSKLTRVYGDTVPEHIWDYSPLSGEGSPGCSYGADSPFYKVNRNPENVSPDHFHFNSSMIVAAEHRESNGLLATSAEEALNSTCYFYEDAMYSATGRGFQGFKAIKVEENFADSENNKATRTEFHNDFPLTGKPKYSEQRLWDEDFSVGNPLSETETTWAYDQRDNGTYFVYQDEEKATVYDLNTRKYVSLTKTDPRYEDENGLRYGNPKNIVTTVLTYIEGSHAITNLTKLTYLYDYSDVSSWWINKLDREYTRPSPTSYFTVAPGPRPNEQSNNRKQVIVDYRWTTDGTRRLKETITQSHLAAQKSIKTWEYDGWGNVSEESTTVTTNGVVETRSSRTTYTADGYFVDKTYNALDHMTNMEVEPLRGLITEKVSPEGVATIKEYDEFGRLLSERTGTLPTVYYAEEFCEGACSEENPSAVFVHTAVSDGAPVVMEYKDLLGRPIKSKTTGFEGDVVQTVAYNARGYKISESQPSYDGDSMFHTTYSDFDALGRYGKKNVDRTGHTHESQVWHYDYSGLRTDIILPDGNLTASRTYDAHGNLFSTTDANGSTSHFRYDGAGNQILIEDVAGNQVIHYFDNLGRNTKIEDADSGVSTMVYNGFGDLISSQDANGTIIRNYYDLLGRPIRRTIDDGTGVELDATWIYDADKKGTLSSMISGDDRYREDYVYDEYLRNIKTIHTVEGETYESETYYDSYYNRVKGKRFPGGEVLAYTFDEFGFLLTDVNPFAPDEDYIYHQVTGMDARGNITSEAFGNGLTAHRDFLASTGLVKDVYFGAGPLYVQHFHYDYDDPFGNVTTRSNVVKGVDEIFTYDSLQRLQSSTRHGKVTTFEYDTIGNLLVKSDFATVYEYGDASRSLGGNAGPHAVRQVQHIDGTSFTFDYDANGNMVSSMNRILTYDAFNKPTRIVENGVTTDMAYAPDLRLYKREDPGQTIYYISDDYEKVIDKSTGKVSEKTYLSNNAAVETSEAGRELRFMHHDRLTSITAITNGAGDIVEERGFDAFGAPLDADWQANGSLLNGEFSDRGFTSHKHLDDHKVIHMDGRLYDPLLGRFFSVDPIVRDPKNTQSQNAYTYVMNNPLSRIDPTGYEDRVAEGEEQTGGEVLGSPTAANKPQQDNGKKGIKGELAVGKDGPKVTTEQASLWEKKIKHNKDVDIDMKAGNINVEVDREGVKINGTLVEVSAENKKNGASVSAAAGIVEINPATGERKVIAGQVSGTLPENCVGGHCVVVTAEIQFGDVEEKKALDGDLKVSYRRKLPPGWEVAKRNPESDRQSRSEAFDRRIGGLSTPKSSKYAVQKVDKETFIRRSKAAMTRSQTPVMDAAP